MSESADLETANLCCPQCMATYRGGFETCPVDGATLGPAAVDPLLGVTIADQYVVDKCVGEGAMGRVYLAHHVRLTKRNFAMKVLLGDLAADPTMRLRFAQEAEAASRLQHPNVVPVLDFGKTDGGLHYLVMDFIDGGTLSDRIEEGPLSEKESIDIAIQICQGLTHAHEQGLVHRDFKPDNVALVKRDGKLIPQILDFGLAIISSPEETSVRLTSAGLVVGTPAYVSPEQCQGKPVDLGTDLFAFGVSLYEMVSGVLPFDGSVIELLYKNAMEQAPPIVERSGIQVSPGLEAIIMRLMAKARGDRFADAREVLAALEALSSPADSVVRVAAGDPAVQLPGDKKKLESAPTLVASTQLDSEALAVGASVGSQVDAVPLATMTSAGGKPRSKVPLVAGGLALVAALAFAAVALRDSSGEAPADTDPAPVALVSGESDAAPRPEPPTELLLAFDAGMEAMAEMPADAAPVAVEPAEIKKQPKKPAKTPKKPAKTPKKPPNDPIKVVKTDEPVVPNTTTPDPKVDPKPDKPPVLTPEPTPPKPVKVPPPDKPPVVAKVPTSFKASASIRLLSSDGPLSTGVTKRGIERAKSILKGCYTPAARKAKKNEAVKFTVSFTINEQARAVKVKVSGPNTFSGLKECIADAVKNVKTKSPPDTGTQSVKIMVQYQPKQ